MSNLTQLPPLQGDLATSHSSGAVYRECPRKYELQFLRQLTPEGFEAPFFVGDMVHNGLEMFYKGIHPRLIIQKIQDAITFKMQAMFIPQDDMDRANKEASIIIGMLMGYFKHYGVAELARWKPLGQETGFKLKFDLGNGLTIPFMGKIDMPAVLNENGQLWMVEHKTTGLAGNDFLMKWHIGFQPHAYAWAGRRMFEMGIFPSKPVGALINVIKKPGIRLKQTETQDQFNNRLMQEYIDAPDKYFAREWIPIGDKDIEWFEKQIRVWINRQVEDYKKGFFAQNTDACHSHYGACRFFPICFQGERDPGVFQYFRLRERQFEEIEEVHVTDLPA